MPRHSSKLRVWAGSPHFGEKTTEGDMALGYEIMRVGDLASTELLIMSFKIRARGTQRMSRRLIFQGNFFAQWAWGAGAEMDGTGRSRKRWARLTRLLWGQCGGKRLGQEERGHSRTAGCHYLGKCLAGRGGAGAPGRQLRENVCQNGSAALLVPTAVLKGCVPF